MRSRPSSRRSTAGTAEEPPALPQDSGTPSAGDQPEFAQALDADLVPKEFDLRPRPGRPTPSPFLPKDAIEGPPAWTNRMRRRHR